MNSDPNCEAKATPTEAREDFRMGVARKRLTESSDQRDALEGLREIVGNFLGSEEMGVLRVDRRTSNVEVVWSFGMNTEHYDLLRVLGDEGLDRMERGECHFESSADAAGLAPRTRAFVPLRLAGRTVAVLAILKLLPQKSGFDAADVDLLAMVSEEAGKAVFGSTVKTEATEKNQ
jgi:hypothetical protein